MSDLENLTTSRSGYTPRPNNEGRTVHNQKSRSFPTIIIEAINATGDRLQPYTIVSVQSGATPDLVPTMAYPSSSDDPELTQYGVVLEDCLDGLHGHVQVGGHTFVRVYQQNDVNIIVGEILYALDDQDTFRGLCSNKASALSQLITKIPLGRSLGSQADDTDILEVNLAGTGGTSVPDIDYADYITTGALTNIFNGKLSNSPTPTSSLDGISSIADDKRILVTKNGALNGLYTVKNTDVWVLISQPKVCAILSGTSWAGSAWYLSNTNTYKIMPAFFG